MATTTSSGDNGSKVEAVRYAESDKIGPLGTKRSILDDERELRRTLVAEFQATADAAREAAAAVDKNPTSAVHEYRKALRRARAVLALVASALPRSERRALLAALREARRALGTARDQAVVPETLSALELDEVDRSTAGSVVDATGDAVPQLAEIKQLLAEGAARAAAQVEALEASLPQTLPWTVVERGLRDTYDEARRARKDAKRSKRSFHRWRRRSKELTYQLELIAGYAGEKTSDLHREIEHVTDTQGPAVDLLMLRDLVRTHANGIAPDAIDRLQATVEAQLADLIADSRRAGRETYKRKPRKFARRVTKRVQQDAAPSVDDSDDIDDVD
jgi:CHAD domain-containing protein